MSEYEEIRRALGHVRRRQARRHLGVVLAGSLWLLILGAAVGSLVLGLTYSTGLHAVLLIAAAGGLISLWVTRLGLPLWRWRRDPSLAFLLERHNRELRNDVTSALEFGELLTHDPEGARDPLRSPGSPVLMQALVERTAMRLRRDADRLERHVAVRRIDRLRGVAVGALVIFALAFLAWPETTRAGLSRLLTGPERVSGATAAVESAQEPLVASIALTYRYPGYTRLSERSLSNPSGRVEVLAGTRVTLEAESLIEVRRGAFVMQTQGDNPDVPPIETEIDMQVTGRHLRVEFTPLQDATYTFELSGPNRREQRDPVRRTILVLPDAVPQVQLTTPEAVVDAAPGDTIPFHFTVSDDFGLTELAFVHAFAGDAELEQRETLLSLEGQLVMQDAAAFELTRLNLQPRDEVVVYVEALDNDTVAGPKAGRSRPVLIRITSAEDRHLELVRREEQIFEKLLEVLGDYLESPIADMRVDDNGLHFELPDVSGLEYGRRYAAARGISQKVLQLLGEMRDLMARMEEDDLLLVRDFEIFQSIYDGLYDLHRVEQNVLTSLGRAASRNALTRHHMGRLLDVRGEQVRETEQGILVLDEMVAAQRMESLQRTLDELNAARERLRELLQEYSETDDQALREEIERELLRLEARMQELLQRVAELMEQLPREHYNIEALQAMDEMVDPQTMADMMQQIRDAIEAGDMERALQMLEDLEAQVQAMMQQIDASQSSGGSGMSELDQRMSELMDEISNLEAQESEVEQGTAELQEAIRERRIEALQEGLEQFVDEARERVAEMREELDAVNGEELRTHISETLGEADSELEALDEVLETWDFESALDRAERALERLANAGAAIRSAGRRYSPESRRGEIYEEAEEQVAELNEEARQLVEELDDLIRRARPTPDPGDQPRMDQLAADQGRTVQELNELMERLQEMSGDMPMLGEELGPSLQQIERYMQMAEGELRGGQLQGARDDEQSALRMLQQIREQMQQMVRRERMGRQQGNRSVERVEIPEEPDETPAEFREDILDAMREESLRSYEEAIRRYYESLVE